MSRVIGHGRYATETYPDPARGGTEATAQTRFWWVCGDTTVVGGDGSPERPFTTVQEAISAAQTEGQFVARVYLTGGGGAVVLPDGIGLVVEGLPGGIASLESLELGNNSVVSLRDVAIDIGVTQGVGAVSGSTISLCFSEYWVGTGKADQIPSLIAPLWQVHLQNAGISGGITCNLLAATGCVVGADPSPSITASGVRLNNCEFDSAATVTTTGSTVLTSCEFSAVVAFVNTTSLEVDSYTDARMTSSGSTNTGGRTVIG